MSRKWRRFLPVLNYTILSENWNQYATAYSEYNAQSKHRGTTGNIKGNAHNWKEDRREQG